MNLMTVSLPLSISLRNPNKRQPQAIFDFIYPDYLRLVKLDRPRLKATSSSEVLEHVPVSTFRDRLCVRAMSQQRHACDNR